MMVSFRVMPPRVLGSARCAVGLGGMVFALGAVWWARPGPWAWAVAPLLMLALLAGSGRSRGQVWIATSTVGVLASTADYLVWRLSVTNWSAAWLSVPLLAAEMFGAAHALGLQATIWPKAASPVRRIDDPSRFPIYLLIPTAGEPMSVLEPTIIGALAARAAYLRRYPSARVHVIVCNDGLVAGSPDWRQIRLTIAGPATSLHLWGARSTNRT